MSTEKDRTEKPSTIAADIPDIAKDAAAGEPREPVTPAEEPASEVAEFQNAADSMTAPAALDSAQGVFGESAGEGRAPRAAGPGRRPRWSGRKPTPGELLTEGVIDRAARAHSTLHDQLRGSVLVSLGNGSERYRIDWTGEHLSAERTEETSADCVIDIQSRDLELIAAGSLNPQIAMLSDKIRVSGNASLAVYFFNLVAPAAGH